MLSLCHKLVLAAEGDGFEGQKWMDFSPGCSWIRRALEPCAEVTASSSRGSLALCLPLSLSCLASWVLGISYMLRLVKKCTLLEHGRGGDMGTHCESSTFISVPWLFQSLSEQDRMEAAAALGTGDLLAGVSVQPSLAEDLNS